MVQPRGWDRLTYARPRVGFDALLDEGVSWVEVVVVSGYTLDL